MGNLLGAPVTEKDTHSGCTNEGIKFAVTSMQGWRVHQEDAHIVEPKIYATVMKKNKNKNDDDDDDDDHDHDDDSSTNKLHLPGHAIFAVFDGHGGSFTSLYCGRNFCRVLSQQTNFVKYAELYLQQHQQQSAETEAPAASATASPKKSNNKDSDVDKRNEKAQQQMIQLLEKALVDAFIVLDREVACALRGNPVPEADTPYHPDDDEGAPAESNGPDNGDGKTNDSSTRNNNNNNNNDNNNNNKDDAGAALQRMLEDEADSGTTACVILLTPEFILCANAGDSRSVLSQRRKRNKNPKFPDIVIPLSYDHKPDNETEERRVRAAGGFVAGGRVEGDLAVSRGLGDFRFKQMDVVMKAMVTTNNNDDDDDDDVAMNDDNDAYSTTTPNKQTRLNSVPVSRPGDQKVSPIPDVIVRKRDHDSDAYIIVACDGIWDVQTNEAACQLTSDLFREGESDLGLICEEICDVCLRMGSKDNMTALVVQFPNNNKNNNNNNNSSVDDANGDDDDKGNRGGGGGSGMGGVLQRRQAREAENSTNAPII